MQKFARLFAETGNKQFLRHSSTCARAIFFLILLASYTALLDVPNYIARYQKDTLNGKAYLGFIEGVVDGLQCKAINQTISRWQNEISWTTLYFTVGLWASNWLATNPLSIPSV